MLRRDRKNTGEQWLDDEFRRFPERLYRDGKPTDQVRQTFRDELYDAGPNMIVVESYSTRLTLWAGRLVVHELGEDGVPVVRQSIPLRPGVSAVVTPRETSAGETVFELVVDLGLLHPAETVRMALLVRGDQRDRLDRIAHEVNAADRRSPAPSGEPEPLAWEENAMSEEESMDHLGRKETYYMVDPTVGVLSAMSGDLDFDDTTEVEDEYPAAAAEAVERPDSLRRIAVRRVPDDDRWMSFAPLAGSEDIVADERAGSGTGHDR